MNDNEAESEQKNTLYSLILKTLNKAIIVANMSEKIIYTTPFTRKAFNLKSSLTTSSLKDFFSRFPESSKDKLQSLMNNLDSGSEKKEVRVVYTTDKQRKFFFVSCFLIKGKNQQKKAIILQFKDSTDRIVTESKLKAIIKHEKKLLDMADIIIFSMNKQGFITKINDNGAAILECSPEEIIGKNWFKIFIPAEEQKKYWSLYKSALDTMKVDSEYFQNFIVTKSSEKKFITWKHKLIIDDQQNVNGIISSGIDITEMKASEKLFLEEKKFLEIENKVSNILNTTSNLDEVAEVIGSGLELHGFNIGLYHEESNELRISGVYTIMPSFVKSLIKSLTVDFYTNKKAKAYMESLTEPTRFSVNELFDLIIKGSNPQKIQSGGTELFKQLLKQKMGELLLIPLKNRNIILGSLLATKKQDQFFSEKEIHLFKHLTHAISLGIYKKYNELKIHKMLYYDDLTRLTNLKFFKEKLLEKINKEEFVICSIKVRDFSRVVSSRGEEVGDKCIIYLANHIKEVVNHYKKSIVSRNPGVNFQCCVNINRENDVKELIMKFFNFFNKPMFIMGNIIHLNVSIGVCFSKEASDIESLIQKCNIALEKAKEKADKSSKIKNNYEIYNDQLNQEHLAEEEIEEQIRIALANKKDFQMHYQPKCNMNGEIIGYEALVRWFKDGQMVSPGIFIPKINQMGLSDQLFNIVLNNVCNDISRLKKPSKGISINISPEQFNDLLLIAKIRKTFTEYKLKPENVNLKFEIIETDLVKADNLQLIKDIRNLGVKISVDDFGSGYSNLKTINDLARAQIIDEIKIDKSLIDGITIDSTLLSVILEMAQKLNIEVVAEGVESIQQYFVLKSLYPDVIIQGWLFSKALPLEEIQKLVEDIFTKKLQNMIEAVK